MATIINNPSDTRPVVATGDSGVGMVVGLLVALVLIVLFVMYVLPSIRGTAVTPAATENPAGATANINLTVPGTTDTPSPTATP